MLPRALLVLTALALAYGADPEPPQRLRRIRKILARSCGTSLESSQKILVRNESRQAAAVWNESVHVVEFDLAYTAALSDQCGALVSLCVRDNTDAECQQAAAEAAPQLRDAIGKAASELVPIRMRLRIGAMDFRCY